MKKIFLVFLSLLFCTAVSDAAKYYCKLNNIYKHSNAGTDTSTAWGGPLGLQRFNDTGAVGDTLLVYGSRSGNCDSIIYFGHTTNTGTWTRGDTINNVTGTGSAVLYQDSANVKMKAWLLSGSFANNDSIRNNASSGSCKINTAVTKPGIYWYKTTGTLMQPFTIIGVNSSWVEDTLVTDTLDGNLVSPVMSCNTVFYCNFKNIYFYKSSADGFVNVPGTATPYYFINCGFTYNTQYGSGSVKNSTFDRCRFNYNTNTGASTASDCTLRNCEIIGNVTGANGIRVYYLNCVFRKNTSAGISANTTVQAFNCVFDSNATGFSCLGLSYTAIYNCKFTNNYTRSITLGGATSRITGGNNIYINNGGSNQISNAGYYATDGSDVYGGTEGYVNRTAGNFSNGPTATGRVLTTKIGQK